MLSTAVFFQRGFLVWRVAAITPGVSLTTGFEEESFFALWRATHDQPVYADTTRIPYAAAYFNWLFYTGYAFPVGVAVDHFGDATIPRAGRLVTAVGALVGAGMLFWLLYRAMPDRPAIAVALASFGFFGPLVGLWAHTIRPDTWAIALETSAVAVLLVHYRNHAIASALFGAALFYGAWACKQTYVLGLVATCAFLIVRRQWRCAAVLVLASMLLWGVTFASAGPGYRAAFRTLATTSVFLPAVGLENVRDMFQKTAPLWFLVLTSWVPGRRTREALTLARSDLRLLALLGLAVAFPLAFVGSCKIGATSNYYFSATIMLAALAAVVIRLGSRCAFAGFLMAIALQLLIACGIVGDGKLKLQADDLASTWSVWSRAPEPRFATLTAFNLPWLNRDSPPLVIAFNYGLDRANGRKFESDGIGGLIQSGYFRSLLLPTANQGIYDGANALALYSPAQTVGRFTLFERRSDRPSFAPPTLR